MRLPGSRPLPAIQGWLFSFGFLASLVGLAARAPADTCPIATVGVDTTGTDACTAPDWFVVYSGSAAGQVFEARDTVLLAVSVFAVPNGTPLRAYVLDVDSTGRPDYQQVLRLGPTVNHSNPDLLPVRYRFEFDPPVVLPRLGSYEFAVQVAPDPWCDGATCLMGNSQDPYAGGRAWEHSRTSPYFGCALRSAITVDPELDLIFELEFCDTHPTVGVAENVTASFALHPNRPNPFRASTTFRFDLPWPEVVRLEVFDLLGRRVATLRNAWTPAGPNSLEWAGRDAGGSPVRPGTYVYHMTAGSFRSQRKLVVLP